MDPPRPSSDAPLEDLVVAWLDHLAAQMRPSTLVAYRRDLMGVAQLLSPEGVGQVRLVDLTPSALQAALATWEVGRGTTSVLRAHSAWKSFFEYLRSEGLVEHNAMAAVTKPGRSERARAVRRRSHPAIPESGDELVSTHEAGRRLGVGSDIVLRLIEEAQLPTYDYAQGIGVRAVDIERLLERSRIPPGGLAHLRAAATSSRSAPEAEGRGS